MKLIIFILVMAGISYSSDWYAGARVGHAFAVSPKELDDVTHDNGKESIITDGNVSALDGNVSAGIRFGVLTSRMLGVDFSIDYVPGKTTLINKDHIIDGVDSLYSFEYVKADAVYVSAAFTYGINLDKFRFQFGVGPMIGKSWDKLELRDGRKSTNFAIDTSYTLRRKDDDISFGGRGFIGVSYPISRNVYASFELSVRGMSRNIETWDNANNKFYLFSATPSLGIDYHF